MKKLILTAGVLAFAASVFAQGTFVFNNRLTGVLQTRVYSGTVVQVGNATDDAPAGTTSWTGFTALTGSGWGAVILGASGNVSDLSTLSLGANPMVTTFRSGGAAGGFAAITATVNSVLPDQQATLQVFVWDRVAGGTDAAAALTAYRAAITAGRGAADFYAGLSNPFVLTAGGGAGPVNLTGLQSFSIVPEPSSMALAGLAAASLLIFRRRK